MRCAGALIWAALGLVFMMSNEAAVAQTGRPEEALTQRYQLERLPASNIWALATEAELRVLWNELPQHRDAIIALERSLAERIERNRRNWETAERTEKSLRTTLASLARADKQRPQFEQQLARLRLGMAPPDRLADMEDVRAQLVTLNDHRHSLWLGAQAIRQKSAIVNDAYVPLQRDEQIQALIRKVGGNHRLGPARNYLDDLKKLPDFERLTLTNWIPLVMIGQRQRVSLLANDSTPITFTWTSSPEPTLITAAMAESIGLKPRPGVGERLVSGDKQSWRAQIATLPYLRIGKYELREIEVAILPPEAESFGARIGPAAFEGYRVEMQPERLRLVISPSASVMP